VHPDDHRDAADSVRDETDTFLLAWHARMRLLMSRRVVRQSVAAAGIRLRTVLCRAC